MLFNNGLKLIYKYWLTLIYTENRNLECPIISVSSLCFTFYVIMACRLKEIFVSTFLLSCFVFLRSWVRMIATTSFSQVHFLEISRNHFFEPRISCPERCPEPTLMKFLDWMKAQSKIAFQQCFVIGWQPPCRSNGCQPPYRSNGWQPLYTSNRYQSPYRSSWCPGPPPSSRLPHPLHTTDLCT